MFPHGQAIQYTVFVFYLTTYTMSSVYSLAIPSLKDSKLHKPYAHKSVLHHTVFQQKNKETQVFLNDLGNVSTGLLPPTKQNETAVKQDMKEAALTMITKTPVQSQQRKIISNTFNNYKSWIRTLKRRKRNVETDISSLSQLHSESTHLFNGGRLHMLDNNSNNTSGADQFEIAQLSQTRFHREIDMDSYSSSEHISDHLLKSDSVNIQKNAWTNMNVTFFRELIRKLAIEREVKHNAQIAFLCLTGLCLLMTWVIWYNSMCRNRSSKYIYWDHKETSTTDLRDIFYRRGKYLPMFQDEEYGVVYIKDKGTNP